MELVGGVPKYTCVCDARRRLDGVDAPAMPSWAVRSSQRELDTSPALPAWASKGATPCVEINPRIGCTILH